MDNETQELTRVVEFRLLNTLPDTYPIVVKRVCLATIPDVTASDSFVRNTR